MATTPLYKSLKLNGTSFYAFPGAAEDISAAYQNSNYRMYFSKFVLLDLPKQNLVAGTMSNKIYFDFDNGFSKSVNATPPPNFTDQIIESLRNYVANHETVLRESRLNNTKYYYDTNALETSTEKIFWKWCKKLGIIDFEPAVPGDEYFGNLSEFARRNLNDDVFFQEYLWKERELISYSTYQFYETADPNYINYMEIEIVGTSNFRVGDKVRIYNVSNNTIYTNSFTYVGMEGSDTAEGMQTDILAILPSGTVGQRIIINVGTTMGAELETTGQIELVYHKLVQYIGEVSGVSNVQEANRSYTEVYAHIPDHTGQTPDILFRTMTDVNYKPNLSFPILPSQIQPEIMGAELFTSPIVNTPANYPGSYFAQFDSPDFTYLTAIGDTIRRSGEYFGVSGDINNPIVDGSTIDGVCLDFDSTHYVKMNIANNILTNFDQFNAKKIDNNPPTDFEFNAILWYYTVQKTDSNGNQLTKTNLYGISFLDHPNNNPIEDEIGLRFPMYKKMVANGGQDGTSYSFNLNLNFNILNENPQLSYNPEAINSLFSMNLFNQAMSRLTSLNDSFLNIISDHDELMMKVQEIQQLVYTQTDIDTIKARMASLEQLLRLYATNQIVNSESIEVITTNRQLSLINVDPAYSRVDFVRTTDLYLTTGAVPLNVGPPTNKDLLIIVENNDEVDLDLPNNSKLSMIIDRDLDYKQSVEIIIRASQFATQNKKMDIFVNGFLPENPETTVEVLLVGDIDLPVYFNSISQLPNPAYLWKDFNFDIDFDQTIQYTNGDILQVPLTGNTTIINNSIRPGDVLNLNNFYVGTASVYDFSGQYTVDSLGGPTSSYIYLDATVNPDLVAYSASASLPFYLHGTSSTLLSNSPYFSLNKGKKIKITRISPINNVALTEKYHVEVMDFK